jgi:hypothetical protein
LKIQTYQELAPVYYKGDPATVPSKEFEVIIGSPLPPTHHSQKIPFTIHNSFEKCSQTKVGPQFCSLIHQTISKLNLKHLIENIEFFVCKSFQAIFSLQNWSFIRCLEW